MQFTFSPGAATLEQAETEHADETEQAPLGDAHAKQRPLHLGTVSAPPGTPGARCPASAGLHHELEAGQAGFELIGRHALQPDLPAKVVPAPANSSASTAYNPDFGSHVYPLFT